MTVRGLMTTIGGLVVAAGVIVGGAFAYISLNRTDPPSPSPDNGVAATTSPPRSAPVSSSPSPSEADPTPTALPSASTASSRDEWTVTSITDLGPYTKVVDVYDDGHQLVALGQADRDQLGIWTSVDGSAWTPAAVPPRPPEGMGGRIVDLARASDGLVALAQLGHPEGSEAFATGIYTSMDGTAWDSAGDLPADVVLSSITAFDTRILAGGGSGIWYSDDGGGTWLQAIGAAALGGVVTEVISRPEDIVAVGSSGALENQRPWIWISGDGGETWRGESLGEGGEATDVVTGSEGTVLVFGSVGTDAVVWRNDAGRWVAQPLGTCCLRDATLTPSGYVAIGIPYTGGETFVVSSDDGLTWETLEPGVGPLTGVSWSDRLGLIATTDTGQFVLGPTPYP